jgi:hypothetical protein
MLFVAALYLFDSGRSLYNLYYEERYARSDYRAIANLIIERHQTGDAVILNAPNQWEVFTYYYPDADHVYPLARQRPLDVTQTDAELRRIVQDHQRLFGVFWGDAESDPERFIEGWLERNTYKAQETWFGDVRLAVYAVPPQNADKPQVPLDVRFVSPESEAYTEIFLDGYTLLRESLAPGDILPLALFWRTQADISVRYKVFVHLYDLRGNIVAQTDSEPGGALRPTDTWSLGEQIVDRYGVLVPQEAEEGQLTVAVGLYEIGDPTKRLIVMREENSMGDRLDLAQVTVEP